MLHLTVSPWPRIVSYGDSAYLAIALEGHGYRVACSEAAEILGNESVQEITWLDDVLLEMQILGSCAISFWVTFAVWICISILPDFKNPYSDRSSTARALCLCSFWSYLFYYVLFVDLRYHDLSSCPALSPFFCILFSLWIAPVDCRFQPWSRVVNTMAMRKNKCKGTVIHFAHTTKIWGYLADQEVVLVPAFLVSQLCIWPFMESISQVADALVFSYRAGSGGYLGIGAMVSERTGLFQVDCVGGPQGFTPFTHHPPKLTQMLVYLNEWRPCDQVFVWQAVQHVESCRIAGFEFSRCIILPSGCDGSCWQFGHVSSLGPPKSPERLQRSSAAMLQKDTKSSWRPVARASMKDRLH